MSREQIFKKAETYLPWDVGVMIIIVSTKIISMKRTILSVLIMCVVFLSSCMKGVDEIAKQNENEQQIREYLLSNGLTPTKDTIGLYAVLRNFNPGAPKLNLGDSVAINFEIFLLNGTRVTASEPGKPLEFLHGFAPLYGLDLALSWMRPGESATVLIPYYLAFGSGGSSDNKVPGYAPIRVEMELVRAKSEYQQIQEYIARNNLQIDMITPEGVYMKWLTKVEQGDTLGMGKDINVAYKGYFLSGKKFDEGALGHLTGSTGLIKGFDLGVRKMKLGEKALIIFPSRLGYEHYGRGDAIPPFAPLAFEVEITKVY